MTLQSPRGTRDLLPEEMQLREFIIDAIRRVYRQFGFLPLETPAFESWELLSAKGSGGEELKNEIYYFKDKSDRELGLRFDLTVPLARVIASNPQLQKPFKRYQIGRVWRYDRPQAGRWREFWQADVDIIGSSRPDADAECLCAVNACLENLGFRKFSIRLNNRKILNGFLEYAGIDKKKQAEVFRSLDKLMKIGENGVISELREKKVENKKIEKLMGMIKLKGPSEKIMAKQREMLKDIGIAQEGMDELESILNSAKAYGFSKRIMLDFSLVRGLDYYTGPIFEFSAGEGIGSIGGGGRYDNLISLYRGRPTPATGISIGIDRLSEVMKDLKILRKQVAERVFVAAVNNSNALAREALKTATMLRSEGFYVLTDVMGRGLKKNLEYANSSKIRYFIIIGEKELKQKKVLLKNMEREKQETLSQTQLLTRLKKLMKTD